MCTVISWIKSRIFRYDLIRTCRNMCAVVFSLWAPVTGRPCRGWRLGRCTRSGTRGRTRAPRAPSPCSCCAMRALAPADTRTMRTRCRRPRTRTRTLRGRRARAGSPRCACTTTRSARSHRTTGTYSCTHYVRLPLQLLRPIIMSRCHFYLEVLRFMFHCHFNLLRQRVMSRCHFIVLRLRVMSRCHFNYV